MVASASPQLLGLGEVGLVLKKCIHFYTFVNLTTVDMYNAILFRLFETQMQHLLKA